jgi:hypothetical protein
MTTIHIKECLNVSIIPVDIAESFIADSIHILPLFHVVLVLTRNQAIRLITQSHGGTRDQNRVLFPLIFTPWASKWYARPTLNPTTTTLS